MRRVSCASTSAVSSSLVWSFACWMASRVISWNTMRRTGTFGLSSCSRCHAMASPSRSSSVASRSSSASFSARFSSATVFFFESETT